MKLTKIILSAFSLLLATAIGGQATQDATWGTVKQHTSQAVFDGAAKRPSKPPAPEQPAPEGRSITQVFDATGGTMAIYEANGSGPKDNVSVIFNVPAGALSQAETITMSLSGQTLSDLIVTFAPAGLVFNVPATLEVYMGLDLVDLDTSTLTVHHEYSDGSYDEAQIIGVKTAGTVKTLIKVVVPGFSRYSAGGGGP